MNQNNQYIADVIIPHHDRDDLLERCVKYINREKFNVIVSAGGSFAENCNTGAKKSVTDNLIFVNDDAEPGDFLLEKMCRVDCDIIGIAQSIPGVDDVIYGLGVQLSDGGTTRYLARNVDDLFIPSGFLFKISKKSWIDLGGFDEQFINGCEDVDLFLRAIEQKISFGVVVDAVIHRHSQSEGRSDNDDSNHAKLDHKWSHKNINQLLRCNNKLIFEKNKSLHWKDDALLFFNADDDLKFLNKFPLVSVIIPSRVNEKIETLASLENQDYPSIEIIIEYDENQEGAATTRNTGAKKAKGEYLFFCDNDLDLYPDCISNLFLTLTKNPHASWAFGKFYIDDHLYNENKSRFVPHGKQSIAWMNYFEGISTMSLIRAGVFPGFDENMLRYDDWDLWLMMSKVGHSPVFCDHILFKTVNRKGGITTADRDGRVVWLEKLYKKYDINVAGYIYDLTKKNKQILASKSFQIGDLFFRSIKKPQKLLTFPYNFMKIMLKK